METMNGEVFCTSPQQFQQSSSRLLHSQIEADSRFSYQGLAEENKYTHDHTSEQILKGLFDEFKVKRHHMHEKFDVPIKKTLLRETLHDLKGRVVGSSEEKLEKIIRKLNTGEDDEQGFTTTSKDRGDVSQEDLKLERFKVKAVNVAGSGVVKEEKH